MKTIEIRWSTEDVLMQADNMNIDLTEEQADDILDNIEQCHYAKDGINLTVIRFHISMYMEKNNK